MEHSARYLCYIGSNNKVNNFLKEGEYIYENSLVQSFDKRSYVPWLA